MGGHPAVSGQLLCEIPEIGGRSLTLAPGALAGMFWAARRTSRRPNVSPVSLGAQISIAGLANLGVYVVNLAASDTGGSVNPTMQVAMGAAYAFALLAGPGMGLVAVIWQWKSDDLKAVDLFLTSGYL